MGAEQLPRGQAHHISCRVAEQDNMSDDRKAGGSVAFTTTPQYLAPV